MNQFAKKLTITPYLQSRKTSCLAACALMVLNYFGKKEYPLEKTIEIEKIHKNIIFGKYELGNFAKLAEFFLEEGFKVKFWLDGLHYKPEEIEKKFWAELLKDFNKSLKRASKTKNFTLLQRDFTVDELASEILLGHPVICETKFENFITHALVIRGVIGNTVYLIDPLKGYRKLLRAQLRREIDLGYMKNAISAWKDV